MMRLTHVPETRDACYDRGANHFFSKVQTTIFLILLLTFGAQDTSFLTQKLFWKTKNETFGQTGDEEAKKTWGPRCRTRSMQKKYDVFPGDFWLRNPRQIQKLFQTKSDTSIISVARVPPPFIFDSIFFAGEDHEKEV